MLHPQNTLHVVDLHIVPIVPTIIELDDGKFYRKGSIFDGKNHGFRFRFSQQNQSIESYNLNKL